MSTYESMLKTHLEDYFNSSKTLGNIGDILYEVNHALFKGYSKKVPVQLLIVFEAFNEICRRISDKEKTT